MKLKQSYYVFTVGNWLIPNLYITKSILYGQNCVCHRHCTHDFRFAATVTSHRLSNRSEISQENKTPTDLSVSLYILFNTKILDFVQNIEMYRYTQILQKEKCKNKHSSYIPILNENYISFSCILKLKNTGNYIKLTYNFTSK